MSSTTDYQPMGGPKEAPWYIAAAKYLLCGAAFFAVGMLVDHTVFPEHVGTGIPNDYVPKCEGSQTMGVTLEEACGRIEAVAGAAGARRKLTGVPTTYSCLPHYRLPLTGTDGRVQFPYHAEVDLQKGDPKVTMAIVVIHGAMRDADNYFCAFYDLHKDQQFRTDEEVRCARAAARREPRTRTRIHAHSRAHALTHSRVRARTHSRTHARARTRSQSRTRTHTCTTSAQNGCTWMHT